MAALRFQGGLRESLGVHLLGLEPVQPLLKRLVFLHLGNRRQLRRLRFFRLLRLWCRLGLGFGREVGVHPVLPQLLKAVEVVLKPLLRLIVLGAAQEPMPKLPERNRMAARHPDLPSDFLGKRNLQFLQLVAPCVEAQVRLPKRSVLRLRGGRCVLFFRFRGFWGVLEFALQQLRTEQGSARRHRSCRRRRGCWTVRGCKRTGLEGRGAAQLLLHHMNLIHQPRQFGLQRVEVLRVQPSGAGTLLELLGSDLDLVALQPCRRPQPRKPVRMRIQNRLGVFQPELVGHLAAGVQRCGKRRGHLASGGGEPLVPLRPRPAGFLRNPMSL